MPIYEYECKKCGCVFETITSSRDTAPPECEKCGSADVVRRLSCVNTIGGSGNAMGGCAPNPSSGFS